MEFVYSSSDGVSLLDGVRDRDKVRARFKLPFRTFAKTEFSENSTDVFGGAAAKVWYTSKNMASGIQLYHPEASLIFKGKEILGVSVESLEEFLKISGIPYEFEVDGSGVNVFVDAIEIGIYSPSLETVGKKAIVEAVYIPISSKDKV